LICSRLELYNNCIFFTLTGAVSALPSYLGLRGLNRTVDAKPIGAGEFSIALFSFLGVSPDARVSNLSGEPVPVTDMEYDGTGYLTLGLGLGDKVEIAGRVSHVWNSLTRGNEDARIDAAGESESISGLSEATLAMNSQETRGGSHRSRGRSTRGRISPGYHGVLPHEALVPQRSLH